MNNLKKFIDTLDAGQFTLLAFVALVFIFALGVWIGKSGVLISQFLMG